MASNKPKKEPQKPKQLPDSKKEPNEQLDLIDVHPENAKEIVACAKRYKRVMKKRVEYLAEEVEAKKQLLELIHEAGLQRLEDGKIRYTAEGMTITVEPRDDLIKVKSDDDE